MSQKELGILSIWIMLWVKVLSQVHPKLHSLPIADFVKEHEIDELLFIGYSIQSTSNYWFNWVTELEKLTQ